MRFDTPILLVGLVVVPVIVYLRLRRRGRGEGALRFSDASQFDAVARGFRARLNGLPLGLRAAAIALLIVAAARPQATLGVEKMQTRGIDIVLALDSSESMQAPTANGRTRFDVVKGVIDDFLRRVKTDRVGLVVFAAQAFTQCPLTLDYAFAREVLEQVRIGVVDPTRTAIGSAIGAAAARLKDSQAKSKLIILLTDGRNNAGNVDPLTAARAAEALDIKVYTIGVGRSGPAAFGDAVVAEGPDENALREIARVSGGRFFWAEDANTLQRVYEDIWKMEKSKIEVKAYQRYRELFPAALIPGLLLLALEAGLATTVLRRAP